MKAILTILVGFILITGCKKDDISVRTIPSPPENLIGLSNSTKSISISWTDRSTNENGFKIERKPDGGIFSLIGTTKADISNYIDTGLIPFTTYTYRVNSYNSLGNSLVYSNEYSLFTQIPTIAIGAQFWTTENLDLSTYSDGTPIPQVTNPSSWSDLTTGAWCYYDNVTANGIKYGKLYNWYALAGIWNEASKTDLGQRKKLAPKGYHVPSKEEWETLRIYLGNLAGGMMKETGTLNWQSPNLGATNSSGFTGLPGGSRDEKGLFSSINSGCVLWSLTEVNVSGVFSESWFLGLDYDADDAWMDWTSNKNGFSVRLLMD